MEQDGFRHSGLPAWTSRKCAQASKNLHKASYLRSVFDEVPLAFEPYGWLFEPPSRAEYGA